MARLDVAVLGPLRVTVDGDAVRLGPQLAGLLSVLVLEVGRCVPANRLVQLLWGADAPPGASATLRSHVSHLRRALAGAGRDQVVAKVSGGYRLDLAPDELDRYRFERDYAQGTELLRAGGVEQAERATELLSAALALWRGPAFADVADQPYARSERGRLDAARWAARRRYAEALSLVGRRLEAIGHLSGLVAEAPYDEATRRLLALALYAERRVDEAAQVCRDGVQLLRDRGLDAPELEDLQRSILLRAVPMAGARPEATADPASPNLLPPDVAWFTGRAEPLSAARQCLDDAASRPPTILVTGPAGVGKTTFAIRLAHQMSARFPDGQLYVDLRAFSADGAAVEPAAALRIFLDALGVPSGRLPVTTPAQTALYRQLLAGRRMLVALDNAASPAQVRPLLPGAPGCAAIVTSRDQMLGLIGIDGAQPVPLDVLSGEEAVELLAERIGPARIAAEPSAARDLATACARLPLALSIVASRAVVRPAFDLASFVTDLRAVGNDLEAWATDDPTADVRTVFSWSYRTLSADSARLFRLLGLHPGPDITVAAAAALAGVTTRRARGLLASLARAHLLGESSPGRYGCHDLLRAYAGELVQERDADGERREAYRRILDYYVHSAHAASLRLEQSRQPMTLDTCHRAVTPESFTGHTTALAWLAAERAGLVAATRQAARLGFDRRTCQLAWALQSFFDRTGDWRSWLATQRIALRAARQLGDRPLQARAHTGLAWVNAWLGRTHIVESHLARAHELYRDLGDLEGKAYVHLCLGWVYEPHRHYRQALEHATTALSLYEKTGNESGQAKALNNMGWYHAQLGEYEAALTHCRQALTQLQATGDRTWQARTWDSLGYAHHGLGQHDRAAACYQSALELFRLLGNRYYQTKVMLRLADAQRALGDWRAAQGTRRHALDILDELGHRDADRVRAQLSSP